MEYLSLHLPIDMAFIVLEYENQAFNRGGDPSSPYYIQYTRKRLGAKIEYIPRIIYRKEFYLQVKMWHLHEVARFFHSPACLDSFAESSHDKKEFYELLAIYATPEYIEARCKRYTHYRWSATLLEAAVAHSRPNLPMIKYLYGKGYTGLGKTLLSDAIMCDLPEGLERLKLVCENMSEQDKKFWFDGKRLILALQIRDTKTALERARYMLTFDRSILKELLDEPKIFWAVARNNWPDYTERLDLLIKFRYKLSPAIFSDIREDHARGWMHDPQLIKWLLKNKAPVFVRDVEFLRQTIGISSSECRRLNTVPDPED